MCEIEKADFLILRFDWDTSRLKQSNDNFYPVKFLRLLSTKLTILSGVLLHEHSWTKNISNAWFRF
jgi:hypothetical protein